jgi:hypothetical protein
MFVEVVNTRPNMHDRYEASIQSSCRRLRLAALRTLGPGGAVRRLKAEGWLDAPAGPAGAGDRARMAAFIGIRDDLARQCGKAKDHDAEWIAYDSAYGLSTALADAGGPPVTPGTSPGPR